MAKSTDPDENSNKTTNPPPKPDNPFIKFRDFADSHISSFLQGIVGLPSAFSNKPNENTRWADIDEDLRRRDERQARQKELKDSEARKLHGEARGEDIPVKQSPNWASSSQDQEKSISARLFDVPLYSPVTPALFAHLGEPGNEQADWKLDHYSSLLPFKPGQDSSDKMKTLQYFFHTQLGSSQSFRSNYSMLPYLLFSPYSPLALSARASPRDEFPYCDAFEDLILISQNVRPGAPFSAVNGILPRPGGDLLTNISWISKLQLFGLLQEKEERVYYVTGPMETALNAMRNKHGDNSQQEAKTEQEMYDRFLRSASPPDNWRSKTFQELGDGFRHMIEEEFRKSSTPEELQDFARKGMKVLFGADNPDQDEQGKVQSPASKTEECVRPRIHANENCNPRDDHPHSAINAGLALAAELFKQVEGRLEDEPRHKKLSEEKQDKLSADSTCLSEDVISESTTTEQHTHEDGSMDTTVTIWKRYADGRETTTTRHHREEPSKYIDQGSMDENEDSTAETEASEGTGNSPKKAKNGWFWN